MERGSIRLTGSEWSVLECLWEKNPQTVMQLVSKLAQKTGWAKSTTITTLRRMEEKGLVHCKISGKAKHYTPAVNQEEAVIEETQNFLNRVYKGSIGLMVSAMAAYQGLSQEEIAQLYAILQEAEGRRDE